MNTKITVQHDYDRDLGRMGGIGPERIQFRFWLSTVANGRKAESRGTLYTIEKPTLALARQEARRIAAYVQMRIDENAMSPKDADAALPTIIAETPTS